MKMNALKELDRAVPCSMVKLGREAAHYWHRPRSGRSTLRVFAFVLLLVVNAAAAEQPLAQSTIVLYNKAVPDSVELAKFYAEQRSIAPDHLIGLNCSTEEEISREEYDTTIADPLREIFKQRHWWMLNEPPKQPPVVTASTIHFAAIIKGIPLKVRSTAAYPGDQPRPGPITRRNEASVDSELAVLAFYSRQISGATPNPYFQRFSAISNLEDATLLLVCRLDAPAVATVRGIIVDSIATEKSGLWGRAYVDGAHKTGTGFAGGDEWLSEVATQLHKVGIPVVYDDTPAIFPDAYPMTDCALYYGWYAGNVAGPFTRPDFRFVPGAITVHIHSFSASTLRDANANWVAPLISRGAAASLGSVYEPYLELTSHLDIFNDRLLHGFTFAESAYMSIRALSWMSVMVGDPLYRPYATWLQMEPKSEVAKNKSAWKAYHEFAIKNATRPAPEFRTLARQTASRTRNGPMIEDLGFMEARDRNFPAATDCFGQSRAYYSNRDDILRVVLEEADVLIKQDKPKRAVDLIGSALRTAPNAPAAPLLRKFEEDAERAASPAAPSR
jgi:uncharacterized protein (TIGR03790 family)